MSGKLITSGFHLPYNPDLIQKAKELRKDMTPAEKKLWYEFLQKFRFRFLRQRPVDHYIVDFYCSKLRLVIEIDGDSHFSKKVEAYDERRTKVLEGCGLRVLRFSNLDVLKNFEGVCRRIEKEVERIPPQSPLTKGGGRAVSSSDRGKGENRLQKYIRDVLGCSRRKAEEFIQDGNVMVNGEIAVLGQSVLPRKDKVLVNGKELQSDKELLYLMLYKPSGYVTTRSDPHAEKTVYNLLPEKFHTLVPVGRLDQDTEGLLLFSNDGDFVYRMTHPKFEIEKEYEVIVNGFLSDDHQQRIEKGLKTKEITTSTAKIRIHSRREKKTSLTIIIHEGQKREIKRIFSVFRLRVVYLKRLRMGEYRLGNLRKGEWKVFKKR